MPRFRKAFDYNPTHTPAAIFGGLDFAQALAADDPRYVKMKASAQVPQEDLCAPVACQVLLGAAAAAAAGTRKTVTIKLDAGQWLPPC